MATASRQSLCLTSGIVFVRQTVLPHVGMAAWVSGWRSSKNLWKLTVAKWLTPNQTWIHRTGIEPDVAVAVPPDLAADEDPVLDRALEVLGVRASTVGRAA